MFKTISKIISIILVITFSMGQIQPVIAQENLATVPLGNNMGVERPGVLREIGEEFEPGSIGRGSPWQDMLEGRLPKKIDIKDIPFSGVMSGEIQADAELPISPDTLKKIVAALNLAMQKAQANLASVPDLHRARAEKTIENMVATLSALYQGDFDKVHFFDAGQTVMDGDDYLLGFNYDHVPGLGVDLIEYLSLDEAAEYIFHEHVPEEHEIGHKIVYEKIQEPIFWGTEGNTLGAKLRSFIELNSLTGTTSIVGKDIPTRREWYRHSKKSYSRSTFGEQLVFGTSGIRELVKYLQDIKCYAIAEAILSYLQEQGEPDGYDAIAIAGDLRDSTPRIMFTQVMAALKLGKEIINAGTLPTPAVVYYGMYREGGAIPSNESTASHCAATPEEKEMNGIKPNRTTGEVLKDHERLILKHVREFMELEFMVREQQSMFDRKGMRKDREELTEEQKQLIDASIEEIDKVNRDAEQMYIDRYTESFGEIFDEKTDVIAFMQHMAVGRVMIPEIMKGLGADVRLKHKSRKWTEDLVVDTEDLRPGLAKLMKKIVKSFLDARRVYLVFLQLMVILTGRLFFTKIFLKRETPSLFTVINSEALPANIYVN